MANQSPTGQPGADKQQFPVATPYSSAKILELAHSIYHLPANCRADIEAYVQMRVLLERLLTASRDSGK